VRAMSHLCGKIHSRYGTIPSTLQRVYMLI
jgi:hypothetical protein